MIRLTTDRLIIRDPLPTDKDTWHRLLSDPKIMYYLLDIMTHSLEESQQNLDVAIAEAKSPHRTKYFFAVEDKKTGAFVGTIGYAVTSITPAGKAAGAGYFILPEYHGQGITTEALRELMRFAFEDDGVYRLETGCLSENRASERVMQKCGFIKEAERKSYAWHDGRLKDRVEYHLLREEWADAKATSPLTLNGVFVHGLGQDSSSWDKVISVMPESFHAHCPDLFALINGAETDYQSLYRAFSDYCGGIPEQLNLCGLSLGGVLALHYTIDNPARVQSLTLMGTQYKMPKTLLRIQTIVFKIMPGFFFKKQGVDKHDFMKMFLPLMESMADLDFSAGLSGISSPSLIICGDRDGANKKAAKGLAEGIPNAKLRFVNRAGHELNAESPDELAAILSEFWA